VTLSTLVAVFVCAPLAGAGLAKIVQPQEQGVWSWLNGRTWRLLGASELAICVVVMSPSLRRIGGLVAALHFFAGSIYLVYLRRHKPSGACGCFGSVLVAEVSWFAVCYCAWNTILGLTLASGWSTALGGPTQVALGVTLVGVSVSLSPLALPLWRTREVVDMRSLSEPIARLHGSNVFRRFEDTLIDDRPWRARRALGRLAFDYPGLRGDQLVSVRFTTFGDLERPWHVSARFRPATEPPTACLRLNSRVT